MIFFGKNWTIIKWATIVILALFLIGNLYTLFYHHNNNTNIISILILGLLLGGAFMFLLLKNTRSSRSVVTNNSHTIVESMKKVFKVVCAEGQFSEIYNYEETKDFLSFIPSTKKALVIIKAKVMVGYDFEKCVWEFDEVNKKINLVSFPQPEILSIEPEYDYYNLEHGIFNKFGKEDLKQIMDNGKKQIEIATHKSDLPKIAAEQVKTLLNEVLVSKNWQLENTEKILGIGN